jgi:hypothetical protein
MAQQQYELFVWAKSEMGRTDDEPVLCFFIFFLRRNVDLYRALYLMLTNRIEDNFPTVFSSFLEILGCFLCFVFFTLQKTKINLL